MSRRIYSDWIQDFVKLHDFIEPTNKLLYWSGVSAVASAVGHNVLLDQVSYRLPLNHYIIFVGTAGVRKTTAMYQGANVTKLAAHHLGINFGSQASSWQAIVDNLAEVSKLEMIYDKTGVLQHSYLTVLLTEFGSLFKSDDAGMVDFLTDMWDLHPTWSKHARKDSAKLELHRPGLNILGATTLEWISDNFKRSLAKGGFGSRILWIHETKVKRLVAFVDEVAPKDYADKVQALARDLEHIGSLKGLMQISPGARNAMRSWYNTAHAALLTRGEDDVQAGFVSRKQAHALKLASLISLSRRDSVIIEEEDMRDAMEKIDGILPDLDRIFSSLDTSRDGEQRVAIEVKIASLGNRVPENRVLAQLGGRVATRASFKEALETLRLQGLVFIEGEYPNRLITHVRNLSDEQKLVAIHTNCHYHLKGRHE